MTTQLILTSPGSPMTFGASGVGTIAWTPQNEAAGRGRLSSVWDRGAGDVPGMYRWRCSARWVATPAANDRFSLWLVTASAPATPALTDGNLTFGDAELTSETELIANCLPIGSVLATASDRLFCSSGVLWLADRYIGIAGWNGSATKALTNTASDFLFSLIPVPDSLQAPL